MLESKNKTKTKTPKSTRGVCKAALITVAYKCGTPDEMYASRFMLENTQLTSVIVEYTIHLSSNFGWAELRQIKFLLNMQTQIYGLRIRDTLCYLPSSLSRLILPAIYRVSTND